MKVENIALFKRFLKTEGCNTLYAGMYSQFRPKDSPEDVEEFLRKVDAKDAILGAFYFPEKNINFGVEFWSLKAVKWENYLKTKSARQFYSYCCYKKEQVEAEASVPLNRVSSYLHPVKDEAFESLSSKNDTEIEKRENNTPINIEEPSLSKFEFIDLNNLSKRKKLNEDTVSFHRKKGNHSITFSVEVSNDVWKSGLSYAHFSFFEEKGKKVFAIVFSNDPDKGISVRGKKDTNLKIASKPLIEYIAKHFHITDIDTYLSVSKNRALTKDYLTYYITK